MPATASMEAGVLEAIDAIRPALQADGGDIVFKEIDDRRRRARRARRRLRDLPGVHDDAEGGCRADHHGPGARVTAVVADNVDTDAELF